MSDSDSDCSDGESKRLPGERYLPADRAMSNGEIQDYRTKLDQTKSNKIRVGCVNCNAAARDTPALPSVKSFVLRVQTLLDEARKAGLYPGEEGDPLDFLRELIGRKDLFALCDRPMLLLSWVYKVVDGYCCFCHRDLGAWLRHLLRGYGDVAPGLQLPPELASRRPIGALLGVIHIDEAVERYVRRHSPALGDRFTDTESDEDPFQREERSDTMWEEGGVNEACGVLVSNNDYYGQSLVEELGSDDGGEISRAASAASGTDKYPSISSAGSGTLAEETVGPSRGPLTYRTTKACLDDAGIHLPEPCFFVRRGREVVRNVSSLVSGADRLFASLDHSQQLFLLAELSKMVEARRLACKACHASRDAAAYGSAGTCLSFQTCSTRSTGLLTTNRGTATTPATT